MVVFLRNEMKKRKLPDVLGNFNDGNVETVSDWEIKRKDILDTLLKEEYGYLPELKCEISVSAEKKDNNYLAGKATLTEILFTVKTQKQEKSFPVHCIIPNGSGKYPAFVFMNFRSNNPDVYMPTEEICDRGFAILSFCYNDVTKDNDDFKDGLAELFYPDGARKDDQAGKISIWAWAASRVLDYALTLDNINKEKVAVIGHSRLGKTALLAGAKDERFNYVISNDSGCSGAAITRNKRGEQLVNINGAFYYWFCENYKKYIGNEDKLPFDQHFLLALTAPRKLLVGSSEEDIWSDPESELLACYAASPVYELYGLKGLICEDRYPENYDTYHEGNIAYHHRKNNHYLSRYDWNMYMNYILNN